jgi:hypothetical protein
VQLSGHQEQKEQLVIIDPYAVYRHPTVMIELHTAPVTHATVMHPWQLPQAILDFLQGLRRAT